MVRFTRLEIGYIFGNLELFGASPTSGDREFSETMSNIWVQFAKTGNPSLPGGPPWPAFTEKNQTYMELGERVEAKSNLRMPQVDLIYRALEKRRRGK